MSIQEVEKMNKKGSWIPSAEHLEDVEDDDDTNGEY
jgi:hypothetical protein